MPSRTPPVPARPSTRVATPRPAPSPVLAAVVAVALALAALVAGAAPADGQTRRPMPPLPLYLALGDSVAAGVGASDPASTGYVPLVTADLQARNTCGVTARQPCRRLVERNIAVSGATTTTLIAGQLPLAVAELEARNQRGGPADDVEVITLDIGGNDVFPLVQVCDEGVTPECAAAATERLQTVAANLDTILGALRSAAGPDTEIVVTTYYNPLPGCQLAPLAPLADAVLEGGQGLPFGLNDVIRGAAATHGATVAETYGLLDVDDLVGGQDCLHPDDSGHAVIADAVASAVGQPPS